MNNLVKFIVKNSGIHYDEITAERNQTLFFEGDECKKVGIIISGKINIISYFSDGKEVVYTEARYPASVEAVRTGKAGEARFKAKNGYGEQAQTTTTDFMSIPDGLEDELPFK